ncbi:hypothetical protein C8R47DRAFT_590283 [Mycena vitilis]|nr:hypothetical protein C8R47DRAFT_590283 [Mycena vitilis]
MHFGLLILVVVVSMSTKYDGNANAKSVWHNGVVNGSNTRYSLGHGRRFVRVRDGRGYKGRRRMRWRRVYGRGV